MSKTYMTWWTERDKGRPSVRSIDLKVNAVGIDKILGPVSKSRVCGSQSSACNERWCRLEGAGVDSGKGEV